MNSKYEIVVSWSGVDGLFAAEVPDLPGCTAHGETREAAIRNVHEAMALWIATTVEHGDPIPEARGKRLIRR